jgi:site-specific DNA recombinase
MDLIAYLRVSTDKQAEEGYGLDVQADDVAAYAAANGHTIVATYTDEGVSGSNGLALREALPEALLALAAGNGQALLIPALHRLSRDMLLQEQLLREIWSMGCEVLSALGSEASLRDDPEDPARRMLRVILGAVNEYERTLIVLRLRKGRAAKHAGGGYAYGSPGYGYAAHEKALVAVDHEQAIIARIHGLRKDGATTRAIANVLNGEGVRAKRGGRWHPETIARIVRAA